MAYLPELNKILYNNYVSTNPAINRYADKVVGQTPYEQIVSVVGNAYQPTYSQPQSQPQIIPSNRNTAPSAPSLSVRQQMEQGLRPWDDNLLNQSQGPSNVDYDAIYNPQLQSLEEQQRLAGSEQGVQQGKAQSAYEEALNAYNQRQQEANTQFEKQQFQTGQRQQEQSSDLQRNRVALSQRSQFYGRGSNVGEAVNEIANQEYFKALGQMNRGYESTYSDINTQWTASKKAFDSARKEADDWLKQQKEQIVLNYQKTVAQINSARAGIYSDRAKAIIDAKNYAKQVADQATAIRDNANVQLQSWIAQQQFLITSGLTQTYKNYQAPTVTAPVTTQSTQLPPAQSTQPPQVRYNAQTQRYEDELGNAVGIYGGR